MRAKGDRRINSATFYTTLLDFTDPGKLGIFIDEEQIENLEEQMHRQGYLEGTAMAGTFNLLRANDLIWSFYVSNYLLGNEPRPFDLLYWNGDSTRMPCAMHSWYLRNMYLENKLKEPGGVKIDGVDIDISGIDIPVCFVSTVDDHIAPWKSTYAGAQLFGGSVKFILGGSGHIAGIINPPAKKKYAHWTNDAKLESPEKLLEGATEHAGSWWPEWEGWLGKKSGKAVSARTPDKVLAPAPGTYVKRHS